MKIPGCLAALLSLCACSVADKITTCRIGSATYAGDIDLSRTYRPQRGPYDPSTGFGGLALFFPGADGGGDYSPVPGCGDAARSGPCCYFLGPPPDAGDDSSSGSSIELSDWNVTATDENPDAGKSGGGYELTGDGGSPFPDGPMNDIGSLNWTVWSGGDTLLIQGSGSDHTVDAFSAQIVAPADFEGLNPDLLWDAGTIPLGQDFALTWTPGGASSVTIDAVDTNTAGQIICTVPDDGSFQIPSAILSNFRAGDQGGLIVSRSTAGCAHSDNAAINLGVWTQTIVGVDYQ